MRKVAALLAGILLLPASSLRPASTPAISAQQTPSPGTCAGQVVTTPMAGHYTGPWHSDGDYHFPVFGRDLDLKIIMDGTLDVTVTPDGRLTGTAQGKVNAPIYHDGQQDVSSGYGTISGSVTGIITTGSSLLVLAQPVIDMHWGTFVGGGYTEERFITMPDYQLQAAGFDCVSAHGTIAEQNFPVQNVTDDSTGQIVQIPGTGSATGTWSLTSDGAARFAQLSSQVDSFISGANGVLSDPSVTLTPAVVRQRIAQPLRDLENSIQQNPDVARCLLDRLAAWEATVVPSLLRTAQAAAGVGDLASLRQAGDLLRSAQLLNLDCSLSVSDATTAVLADGHALVDRELAARAWPDASLVMREVLLLGDGPALQGRIDGDLRSLLTSNDSGVVLDVARAAELFGDGTVANAAYQQLLTQAAHAKLVSSAAHNPPAKHKKKRRKPASHPKPKPTPTLRPTQGPRPTPTPHPKTLSQVLMTGIASMTVQTSGATFSWQPVAGASRYALVLVSSGTPVYAWSGRGTQVTYGDTSLDGVAGSDGDAWPGSIPGSYTWSVIAVNESGKVIAAAFPQS